MSNKPTPTQQFHDFVDKIQREDIIEGRVVDEKENLFRHFLYRLSHIVASLEAADETELKKLYDAVENVFTEHSNDPKWKDPFKD